MVLRKRLMHKSNFKNFVNTAIDLSLIGKQIKCYVDIFVGLSNLDE